MSPLIRPANADLAATLLPAPPRKYTVTLVTNSADPSREEAQTVAAGALETTRQPLDASYPAGMFSLSHVALPFPLQPTRLYGSEPARIRGLRRASRRIEARASAARWW